jgi:gas vesicle protein
MAYAGKVGEARKLRAVPNSRPHNDSRHVGKLITGVALGLVVGAAIALAFAPGAGSRTRRKLRWAMKEAGWRSRDAWDDLRLELRRASRQLSRARRRATSEVVEHAPDMD